MREETVPVPEHPEGGAPCHLAAAQLRTASRGLAGFHVLLTARVPLTFLLISQAADRVGFKSGLI